MLLHAACHWSYGNIDSETFSVCRAGELNCEVCAVIRGGLIGAVVGGFYPVLLALPVNASLAARYVLLTCNESNVFVGQIFSSRFKFCGFLVYAHLSSCRLLGRGRGFMLRSSNYKVKLVRATPSPQSETRSANWEL